LHKYARVGAIHPDTYIEFGALVDAMREAATSPDAKQQSIDLVMYWGGDVLGQFLENAEDNDVKQTIVDAAEKMSGVVNEISQAETRARRSAQVAGRSTAARSTLS